MANRKGVTPRDPTLRSIRELSGYNQRKVSNRLGYTENTTVSYKELKFRIKDLTIDFLRKYVEACDGKLEVVVKIDNKEISL